MLLLLSLPLRRGTVLSAFFGLSVAAIVAMVGLIVAQILIMALANHITGIQIVVRVYLIVFASGECP